VPHSLIPNLPERSPPTLWPPASEDARPTEVAVEACKEEGKVLKDLAVDLVEIILRNLVGKKKDPIGREPGHSSP
jgi:hypothetical protein